MRVNWATTAAIALSTCAIGLFIAASVLPGKWADELLIIAFIFLIAALLLAVAGRSKRGLMWILGLFATIAVCYGAFSVFAKGAEPGHAPEAPFSR